MAFFSLFELADILIMTIALGYVFKDFFGMRGSLPADKKKMAHVAPFMCHLLHKEKKKLLRLTASDSSVLIPPSWSPH